MDLYIPTGTFKCVIFNRFTHQFIFVSSANNPHTLCHFLSIASYAPGALPSRHISLSPRTCFFDTSFSFTSEHRDRYVMAVEILGDMELFWSEIEKGF